MSTFVFMVTARVTADDLDEAYRRFGQHLSLTPVDELVERSHCEELLGELYAQAPMSVTQILARLGGTP
jgi:hypothetical protein